VLGIDQPTRTRGLAAALIVLVILFVGILAVGLVAPPSGAFGSPAGSALRAVENVFPARDLTVKEIRRGGQTCLQGVTLVVRQGGGCSFIVPRGVHVVVFRRVAGSPGMFVTLSQTGDLTQNVDTGRPGPDPRDPLKLRFAVVGNATTVTLSACRGPGSCRLDVAG
jgi:hypothetical protein